jgi:hypothetical protein
VFSKPKVVNLFQLGTNSTTSLRVHHASQLPSEKCRIHLALFAYGEIEQLGGWPVQFLFKPEGPEKEWEFEKKF